MIVMKFCFIVLINNSYCQEVFRRELIIPAAFSNSPVKSGNDLILKAQGGTSWFWTGPNNFLSTDQVNIIYGADSNSAGTYYLQMGDTIDDTTYYFYVNVAIMSQGFINYKQLNCNRQDLI